MDGKAIPAKVLANPFNVSGFWVGDGSLTLSENHRFSLALAGMGVSSGGVVGPTGPLTCEGSWVVRGQTIDFQPQNSACNAFSGKAGASAGSIE
ncbi:MAG TPA: hypothetical protein VHM30_06840, partial [Gemmatimonadaceae bacterium]|nr:hypothetical protein [Gemmatimonadaceae bacterium]